MIEVSRTVHTTTPIEQVAAYLSDFTTSADWDPHTAHCRRVEGTSWEPAVGDEYDNTQRIGPLRTTLRYRVATFEPGRRILLESHSGTLDATDMMDFAPRDDGTPGTVVTYTARFRLKGPAKLAAPVLTVLLNKVADDGEQGMQRELDRLGRRTDAP